MDLTGLIQAVITGLADGLIFALVALGYTLVYGIIELINFAHGDVFMIGSVVSFFLVAPTTVGGLGLLTLDTSMPPGLIAIKILAALAIAIAVTAGLNVAIERLAYRPLRHAPKVAPLISAIGMSFVLQNVGILFIGSYQRTVEPVFPATNLLGFIGIDHPTLELKQVFVGLVTIPLLLLLTWFVGKTRQGRAMRATAQDPQAAGLMGVDVNRTIALTFLIGGALAGAAGVVQMLYNNVTVWNLGFRFGLNSFTAAVLGGIGNLRGAVLGALILGQVNALSDRYIAPAWTNAIVFVVLIAIMVFRPTGLLGQQLADRA
jgi:branched-chain amino acid transport system permease protein